MGSLATETIPAAPGAYPSVAHLRKVAERIVTPTIAALEARSHSQARIASSPAKPRLIAARDWSDKPDMWRCRRQEVVAGGAHTDAA
jgi:hypothetical protein